MPSIDSLRRLTQSLAVLDAIIQRNWVDRYYSFNARWDANEQMASMRNGEGDSWFCVFGTAGAFLKGFAHESVMAMARSGPNSPYPGILNHVPKVFESYLSEPAFSMERTTFCIWRTHADSHWCTGNIAFPPGEDPDGSAQMLSIFDCRPATYHEWAQRYYRRPVSLALVEQIYGHRPLTSEIVHGLNPATDLSELSDDLNEIAYPLSVN
jgi:hypothetical protein